MQTIYKYRLHYEDKQVIEAPHGAVPRSVGLDPQGNMCVWMEVETANPLADVTFHVRGTGHPVPEERTKYLGHVLEPPFVWHVWQQV